MVTAILAACRREEQASAMQQGGDYKVVVQVKTWFSWNAGSVGSHPKESNKGAESPKYPKRLDEWVPWRIHGADILYMDHMVKGKYTP